MIRQSPAKIFLADQRGIEETRAFRSCHLFNCDSYFNPHKTAFGNLCHFDDAIIAGAKQRVLRSSDGAYVVLLPLYGAIEYSIGTSVRGLVTAGQVLFFSISENDSYRISNPFDDTLVNYLELRLAKKPGTQVSIPALADIDLNKFMNVLVQVAAGGSRSRDHWRLAAGKFSGRSETVYERQDPDSGIFVFVIDGVFEIEGRLLHARDGLALWGTPSAEIEALSNDALLLVVETSFSFSNL